MTELKRPWWKRKPWWTAAVALLVAGYPATAGPATYAAYRHWIEADNYYRYWHGPVSSALQWNVPLSEAFGRYVEWWCDRVPASERDFRCY